MVNGKTFTSAIIVAAGSSTRMGKNKMLLEIGSQTVFERTVFAFEESEAIDEIIVVTSEENMTRYRESVRKMQFSKVKAIVCGGLTRQESVRKGLDCCSKNADYVAIHDGARPLIKPETIAETVREAEVYGAAAVAIRSRDTIKTVDSEGFAVGTVARENTVLVQTPQIFRRDLIVEAHRKAADDGFVGTDDCALIEHMGMKTKMVYIPYFNIKLTVPDDITLVRSILISRGKL